MAVTSGVSQRNGSSPATPTSKTPGSSSGGGGSNPLQGNNPKAKRNRLIAIGAAVVGGIFLLSHRGSSAQTTPTDPNALTYPPGGYAPLPSATSDGTGPGTGTGSGTGTGDGSGSGTGTGSGDGSGSGTGSGDGSGLGSGGGNTTTEYVGTGAGGTNTFSGAGSGGTNTFSGAGSGSSYKVAGHGKVTNQGTHNTKKTVLKKTAPKSHPKPKQGHKTTPHPASKSGSHPATKKKTSGGHKKSSPAVVESVKGAGSGVVVMGREFPGALAHRLGPPLWSIDGGRSVRKVHVDYGGRTEVHLVHGNGDMWTDLAAGMNPPSRGVPIRSHHPLPR